MQMVKEQGQGSLRDIHGKLNGTGKQRNKQVEMQQRKKKRKHQQRSTQNHYWIPSMCNKVLAQPANAKIADSNIDAYGSLLSTLGAKCKSDANINVVIEAAKVVEGLATGLGRPFGRFRGIVMPGMIERLKERKANVVEALGKALDAVFTTVSFVVHEVGNS
jgi:hypothetical protein